MTEIRSRLTLAGRSWDLPHLPFRVLRSIQPALFQVYEETGRAERAPLSEGQIDLLAMATWRAVAFVEPALTYEAFAELRFSVADLFAALPAVAQAAGLVARPVTAEASSEPGK